MVRPEPAQVGARTVHLPSSSTHITSFSHGGKGERGGDNWKFEINVAQVAGWHLRRRTVETYCTEYLHSKLACIVYKGNKVVPLTCSSCRSPPMLCGRHAHGWHAVSCQRCGAKTEIARPGLDGP